MPNSDDQLTRAVVIARLGETGRAMEILRNIVRQSPDCGDAWLWISELSGTLEEQTEALEKAHALLPADANGQKDLQSRLNSLRMAIPLPGPSAVPVMAQDAPSEPPKPRSNYADLLRQAERLAIVGNSAEAVRILRGLLAEYPQEEQAYLLLAEAQLQPEEKVQALEKLLALNPHHPEAARRLQALRPVLENPLQRGVYLEEQGEFEQAIELYRSIHVHSPDAAARIEANRRIADLRLRQEAYQVQPVHPTLNLLRVMAGPVLLFALMVFIQSGLNLLHLPLLTFPGLLAVMAGSLLVSASEMRPAHPWWVKHVGRPGEGSEPQSRRSLRLLGWGLMAIPFTLFLIEAGFRLGVMQASMMEGLY